MAQSEHTVEQPQDREITSALRALVAYGARTTATAFRIQVQPRAVDPTESQGNATTDTPKYRQDKDIKAETELGTFQVYLQRRDR